jgi:hypothetical protein
MLKNNNNVFLDGSAPRPSRASRALAMGLFLALVAALGAAAAAIDIDFRALDFGADHASDTPVIAAAKSGQLEQLIALLEGGADVNAANAFGMTALHAALYPHETGGFAELAEHHRTEIVHELLAAGADLHAEDGFSLSPLMLADNQHLHNKIWTNYYGQKYYHNVWDLKVRAGWPRLPRLPRVFCPHSLTCLSTLRPPLHPPLSLACAQVSEEAAELVRTTARDDL